MSSYNYSYFVSDFAKRTIANLEMIERIKREGIAEFAEKPFEASEKIFEVTQLLNSFFALLIVPHDR